MPWFYHLIPLSVGEDIEVRICHDEEPIIMKIF